MVDRDERAPDAGGDERPRLTPADVQRKEFRVSFRGYNERDVDEFLDLVTEELQRYEREVMRLRSERASLAPAPLDADEQAQRILREARDEADRIVREAEVRAAAIPFGSTLDTRAVIGPYLNRERDFLQSLGSLVQEHAQMIKTMVEEARRLGESTAPAPAAPAAPPGTRPPGAPGGGEAEQVVVLTSEASEPETESSGASAPGDERGGEARAAARRPQHEGARSLRELFWGEE